MTIFIDVLNNSIIFLNGQITLYSKEYDYSLSPLINKLKAINELKDDEEFNRLPKGKSNDLILPNDLVGFGSVDIPSINKRRNEKDIFLTQFRLAFPNYKDYYVDSFELSRTDNNVSYLYAFSKISVINQFKDAFNSLELPISNVTTLNQMFISLDKGQNAFPQIYLSIGKYNSELFIIKDNHVLSNNIIGFGEEELNGGTRYLYSAYNIDNKKALSFSEYIKNSLSSNKDVSEEELLSFDLDKATHYNEPKQMRLLKDQALKQYLIKNAYTKYYARIIDILKFYSAAPYYIPTNNINVLASDEVYTSLAQIANDDQSVSLTYIKPDIRTLSSLRMTNNALFNTSIKEERKKFDWKAFFNMEIGKKKKGLTLIETVIALSITAIVSLAVVSLTIYATNGLYLQRAKSFFIYETENISTLYLANNESNYVTSFNHLTGLETTEYTNTRLYYHNDFTYSNDTDYSYYLDIEFSESGLSFKSYTNKDALVYERSVER